MKNAEAIEADSLVDGKLAVTAKQAIHNDIPAPLIMKTVRRPSRSMAKKAKKQHRNFHVRAHDARIFERFVPSSRFCWKIVDASGERERVSYLENTFREASGPARPIRKDAAK